MVYNPQSGDGRVAASLSEILDRLTKDGYDVTVRPTQAPMDAMEYIYNCSQKYDRILVVGGDGILHEAVNGLAGQNFEPVLAYLPSGTTNDFANTHGISLNLLEAVDQFRTSEVQQIDLGVFNKEYFTYVAACGVATAVSYETSQEDKKRFGPLAYIVRALSSVDFQHWENNCTYMEIEWEGGKDEGDFLFVSISNSKYIGGSDMLVNNFCWNDGLLEGLFIRRPMNLIDLNSILAGILRKDYPEEYFIQVQSPWFDIHCQPASWTLDGEFGGVHEHVRIEAASEALRIALPKKKEQEA